jgi:hypothetical protein
MNPGRGIALKVASTFRFHPYAGLRESGRGHVPPGQIVFSRSFFALAPILCVLLWQRQLRGALRTGRPGLHVSRAAVGLTSMAFELRIALGYLPLPGKHGDRLRLAADHRGACGFDARRAGCGCSAGPRLHRLCRASW